MIFAGIIDFNFYSLFPNVTDWLNAIGSLATVGSFIYLILQDIRKGKKIDNLAELAQESKNQTTILKAHNDIQTRQTELQAEQLEVLRNQLLKNQQNGEGIDRLAEIEKEKLRISLLPIFTWSFGGGMGMEGTCEITLHNSGERAVIQEVKESGTNIVYANLRETPFTCEKDTDFIINVRSRSRENLYNAQYNLEMIYDDKAGNRYKQLLECKGAVAKFNSSPELLG